VISTHQNWPEWWQWELDCSNPHLLKRMVDRAFNETDVREMLELATNYRPDFDPGRWLIDTTYNGTAWEVIVEPDASQTVLIVVTAYRVG
jgi:hypothetical protein